MNRGIISYLHRVVLRVGMGKILLAVSDRWVPDARVDAIGDFAQRLGRSILAVHVAYGSEGSGAEVTPGERVLEQIAKQLRAKQAKVETLFLFGDDLGQAILKTAEEHQATMIVLGLSAKGVLTRLIEGNVAQEIIRGTRIPVLLLPPDWVSPI
jgi:nucleotide-binding universal stress UspA family protein